VNLGRKGLRRRESHFPCYYIKPEFDGFRVSGDSSAFSIAVSLNLKKKKITNSQLPLSFVNYPLKLTK